MLNPGQVDVQYESYSPGIRLTRGKQSVCEKGLNYPRATLNLGLNKAKVGVGPLCPSPGRAIIHAPASLIALESDGTRN